MSLKTKKKSKSRNKKQRSSSGNSETVNVELTRNSRGKSRMVDLAAQDELFKRDELTLKILNTPFSYREIVEHFSKGEATKGQKRSFGSLKDAILCVLPDRENIEELETLLRLPSTKENRKRERGSPKLLESLYAGNLKDDVIRALAIVGLVSDLKANLVAANELQIEFLFDEFEGLTRTPLASLSQDPLLFVIGAIELPLQFAAGMKSMERSAAIVKQAAESFSLFLEQAFDESGWIHYSYRIDFASIAASLLRVQLLLKALDHKLPKTQSEKCEWIALRITSLLDETMQPMLGGNWIAEPGSLLGAMRRCTDDESEDRLYRSLEKKGTASHVKKLPDCGDYGDTAKLGMLRTNWQADSPRIAIAADPDSLIVEIASHYPLISGAMTPSLVVDGKKVEFTDDSYELNCWQADGDVHYLELERKFDGGVWQRQFALCRPDRLLVIADAILCDNEFEVEYSCTLPVAEAVSAQMEAETREVYLRSDRGIEALVLPITLGEWQSEKSSGDFAVSDSAVALNQKRRGRMHYAAIAVDLDLKRCNKPRTWRRLNVAENLCNVSEQEAVAYRIQIGEEQWVLYRSLAHMGNRTFLGKNVHCDFFLGRFSNDGTMQLIIEIE